MSISAIRSMFEKTGCQIVMIGVGALVALSLIFVIPPSCGNGSAEREDTFLIASVGDKSLSVRQYQDALQLASQQFGRTFGSAQFDFAIKSDVLDAQISSLVMLAIAESRGVAVTDEDVLGSIDQDIEMQRLQIRMQMEQDGRLQPGATEQEFQQIAGEELRRMEENITSQRVQVATRLETDPGFRQFAYGTVVRPKLLENIARNLPVSQEDIIRNMDNFVIRRLSFADPELTTEQNRERANQAKQELDGGADFVATMEKFMPDQPTDTLQFPRSSIRNNPTLEPILEIQPGQHSGVIDAGVPTIYQLVRVEENVPEDFEDNLEFFRSQYASQEANAVLQREIDDNLAGQGITWHIESYRIAFELNRYLRNESMEASEEENKARFLELANEARAIYLDTGEELDMAALTYYVAFDSYYSFLSEEERADPDVVEQRIESLEAARYVMPDVDIEIDLAQLYMDRGDTAEAGARIIEAALANMDFQIMNENHHQRISEFINTAEAAGSLDPEDIAKVREELQRWAREKAEYDREMREFDEELGGTGTE